MKIVINAKEEEWKYSNDYFYYPVCLPTLKLIQEIYQKTKYPILFISTNKTVNLIQKFINEYNIEIEANFISEYKDLDHTNENLIKLDLNRPLLYYLKKELIKLIQSKNISLNKFLKKPEFNFKINKLKDFEKLFEYIKRQSKKKKNKNNVFLGQNIFICPLSEIGNNNLIMENTFIINSKMGNNNILGPNTFIIESNIQDNNKIFFSVVKRNNLLNFNKIGPFSNLRENNELNDSKIGAFVECKNVKSKENLKAGHLAYLGDLIIEKNVNIGAGVVFANYDGKNKYTTVIKENVFIGSNSVIISPKIIGANSYIGAGSIVTKNIEEYTIVFGNPAKVYKKIDKK